MALPIVPRGEPQPDEVLHAHKFSCAPEFGGGPLDPQPPTRRLSRELFSNIELALPPRVRPRTGKRVLPMWIIEDPLDPDQGRTFPSKLIRTRQGDTVHATVTTSTNVHTIHWHGIEPSPMNDGVGHTSFEIDEQFVYQFMTNAAGTYFYHCHKNTTLHFEMGMYGLLIVDPPQGPGFVAANVPAFPGFDPILQTVPYDVEAIWVPDEMDSMWHELDHDAFMLDCDEDDPLNPNNFTRDGILHDFRPDVFVISGAFSDGTPIQDPRVAVTAQRNQTILVRLLNAGYTVQEYTLGLDAIVIAVDGRALGGAPFENYSKAYLIRAGTPFRLTTARRFDLLLRPTAAGSFPFRVRYLDWIKGAPLHTATTAVTVR